MNLNLSASLNVFRLVANPTLCLPHATVATFNDVPVPLDRALGSDGRRPGIKAVVLDKDDCFAYPDSSDIYPQYKERFEALRAAYPGRRLLVVSNTAGAWSSDPERKLASEVEKATGVTVLTHRAKKTRMRA